MLFSNESPRLAEKTPQRGSDMKKLSTVLLSAAAIGALALAACGDDSSSGPANSSEGGNSSASDLSGASSAIDSVIVNPDDSSLVVPTAIAPIVGAGAWEDTASATVKVNCGTDADRIKSVDADAYIDFACAVKIEPAKGQTVKLKAVRSNGELPEGWYLEQSFDGDRTQGTVSGPFEFGLSSAMLQIKIMPPGKGYVNIEMRIEDADNSANAIVIPFLAVRTK